ncbi:hypothetical protein Peetri_00171 [Pseudomonas phage vB_PpuM-Peetri]
MSKENSNPEHIHVDQAIASLRCELNRMCGVLQGNNPPSGRLKQRYNNRIIWLNSAIAHLSMPLDQGIDQ